MRFNGKCPSSPAVDRLTLLRNAGTSIGAISTPASSKFAPVFPSTKIQGDGHAASILAPIWGNAPTARHPHSTKPAPISKRLGACFCRDEPRPISRLGAMSGTGPRKYAMWERAQHGRANPLLGHGTCGTCARRQISLLLSAVRANNTRSAGVKEFLGISATA